MEKLFGQERQILAYHGIMIILITTKRSENKAYIDYNVISYHYFVSPFVLIEAAIIVGTDSLLATNCKKNKVPTSLLLIFFNSWVWEKIEN